MTQTKPLAPKSATFGTEIFYSDYATYLADALAIYDEYRKDSAHHTDYYIRKFTGTKSFPAAVEIARNGWRQGTTKVAQLTSDIVSKVSANLKDSTMYLDVTTQYCWDMASAVAGVPQCGVNFSPESEKKLVRILVNINASAGVGTDVLMAKAATIAALVASLEHCNFDTEIICGMRHGDMWDKADSRYPEMQCSFMLKSAGTALDINSIAFALGHPSFLRRIHFNWIEQFWAEDIWQKWGASFGLPVELQNLQGDIVITRAYYGMEQWTSPAIATEWILEQLQLQGVQLA